MEDISILLCGYAIAVSSTHNLSHHPFYASQTIVYTNNPKFTERRDDDYLP